MCFWYDFSGYFIGKKRVEARAGKFKNKQPKKLMKCTKSGHNKIGSILTFKKL